MRALAWLAAATLAACTTPVTERPAAPPAPVAAPAAPGAPRMQMQRSSFAGLPGWQADDVDALAPALARQCANKGAAARAPWPRLCTSFSARGALPLRDWVEREFEPWRIAADDGNDQGLITGYHEPLLRGARRPDARFATPLHRRPTDLLTVELGEVAPTTKDLRLRGRVVGSRVLPYADRREIETRGVLTGQELLWVDDPVDAFFLHIQGSGRVQLTERDGTRRTVRLAYADQNGHAYVPVGRLMMERGLLAREQADAAGIKAWLRANPAAGAELMRDNPSYVFFSEESVPARDAGGDDPGPRGALGVPLTPGRSAAIDPRFLPLGSLVVVDTPHPLREGRLSRVLAAQDTGGAIRGAVRADVFWGPGEEAERAAGRMRSAGGMWLLWPRGEALPPAARSR